jgi:hypothetical protein
MPGRGRRRQPPLVAGRHLGRRPLAIACRLDLGSRLGIGSNLPLALREGRRHQRAGKEERQQ